MRDYLRRKLHGTEVQVRMAGRVAPLVLIAAANIILWSSGCHQAPSDGLSAQFRSAAKRAVYAETFADLDLAIKDARLTVSTHDDTNLFKTIEWYGIWYSLSEKRRLAGEQMLSEYRIHSIGNPKYAAALRQPTVDFVKLLAKDSEQYLAYAAGCRDEAKRRVPLPDQVRDPVHLPPGQPCTDPSFVIDLEPK